MYNKAIEILKIFSSNGFLAYIVGGYPRDTILGIMSDDIDICTNAKPVEIMKLFEADTNASSSYGSIKIIYKNSYFDITTWRIDIKYEDNRKPIKIKYVNNLKKDLQRRDFTINTICIDSEGNYIDLLKGKVDIDGKRIKCIGNPNHKIKEDSLRILRAIRFAANLDFTIDAKTKEAIKKYSYLLKTLSSTRKKEELNKIFSMKNKNIGKNLLLELNLDKYLGIKNLKDVVMCDDIIGVWSQLELDIDYPFNKIEKENIKKIKEILKLDIDNYTVYKYGLYLSTVAGSIKNISYQKINEIYEKLSITSKKDINIKPLEVSSYLNKKPDKYLSIIIDDIEKKIVNNELNNEKEEILKYIGDTYGNI